LFWTKAVNSFNTVLAVFEIERNMFYRHKAANMYNVRSILIALSVAELPFIMLSSMVFCVCFYFLVGFSLLPYKFFLYYLFFTLNLGAFTFLGQVSECGEMASHLAICNFAHRV
jgi:ABC-type multidrug transport system permease subunit